MRNIDIVVNICTNPGYETIGHETIGHIVHR